jgi:hypothetical protein
MKVLTNREVAVVEAIAAAFFPREGRMAVDADEAKVADYVDRFVARLPLVEALGFRALFAALEFGIVAVTRDPRSRLTTATDDQRRAWLESWETSASQARRNVFAAIRSMFTIAYASADAVKDGYDMREREALIEAELERVAESARAAVAEPTRRSRRSSRNGAADAAQAAS